MVSNTHRPHIYTINMLIVQQSAEIEKSNGYINVNFYLEDLEHRSMTVLLRWSL